MKFSPFLSCWIAVFVAGFVILNVVIVAAAPTKPHIILILADDFGHASVGYNARNLKTTADDVQHNIEVHTPTLDSLADSGVILSNHYSYKICAPSRSALQSGRLATHVNTVNVEPTVYNPLDPVSGAAGIPRNMTTVAQKLQLAGYKTHAIGKWDVGMLTPLHTPRGRGYSSYLGYYHHANDYYSKRITINSTGAVDTCLNAFIDLSEQNSTYAGGVYDKSALCDTGDECYEEFIFKNRALSLINEHDVSSPMFLFYSFHLVHSPLQVPQAYLDKIDAVVSAAGGVPFDQTNRRLVAAMTLYMDDVIAEIVTTLKAKGMYNDTLIAFLADNGGAIYSPGGGNNYPLRGGKYSDFQGGVNTNAFISGGAVPLNSRGKVFDGVFSIADWYATFCEIAGVDPTDHAAADANPWLHEHNLPLLAPVDGVPQWQVIVNATSQNVALNARPGPLHLSEQAVLEWPFKLVTGKQRYGLHTGPLYPNCTTTKNLYAGKGPQFGDIRIFETVIPTASADELDTVTWVFDCGSEGCLFNLELDPEERFDLASDATFTEKKSSLLSVLNDFNTSLFNPNRGSDNINSCMIGLQNGGFYGPFVDIDGYYTPVPPPSLSQHLKNIKLEAQFKIIDNKRVQQSILKDVTSLEKLLLGNNTKKLDKCIPSASSDVENATEQRMSVDVLLSNLLGMNGG